MGVAQRIGYKQYRTFPGKNIEQMPKLVSQGRIPMNISQIMQKRLEDLNGSYTFPGVLFPWIECSGINSYIDSGDVGIYHPNGDLKIVLDSDLLKKISCESNLSNGGLLINEEIYNQIPGEIFKKTDNLRFNFSLTKEQAKENPIWKYLARDEELLNDYVDFIYSGNKHRKAPKNAMGIYRRSIEGLLPQTISKKVPEMRTWSLGGVLYDSNLGSWDSLESPYGVLIGILPEEAKKIAENYLKNKATSNKKIEFTEKHHNNIIEKLSNIIFH